MPNGLYLEYYYRRMDPALVRDKQAFKQRSMAVPVVEKKKHTTGKSPAGPKKKKKTSKSKGHKSVTLEEGEKLKKAVLSGPRSAVPNHRMLKAVVDMMGRRYTLHDYQPLSLEEILTELGLTELRMDTREWLLQALKVNTKMVHYSVGEKFLFKPALGLDVRTRRQLLERLREYDREGLGGVLLSEVKEALPHPERSVQKLDDDQQIMKVVRLPDKEEILFYNDRSCRLPMLPEFRTLWHRVSVDGLTEADIDKYLQSIGLGAMQGESRKRRVPTAGNKAKKSRASKVLNVHLDHSLLKDYSDTPSKVS